MSYLEQIDSSRLPHHVAIIMDGNGRWARNQGKDRFYGHVEGLKSVRKVIECARKLGIQQITLYTFSTENWNRPDEEVNGLMNLMVDAIERETADMIANGISMLVVGDLARLPVTLQEKINWCMQATAACNGMKLVLAVSYSSRWEIVEAVRALARDVEEKKLKPEDIDEKRFETYLKMHEFSDPDLLIRTGGELRLSNFLLWQLAYAELYFTDTPWPEFREEAFFEAIHSFQTRERRFGKISDQIQPQE